MRADKFVGQSALYCRQWKTAEDLVNSDNTNLFHYSLELSNWNEKKTLNAIFLLNSRAWYATLVTHLLSSTALYFFFLTAIIFISYAWRLKTVLWIQPLGSTKKKKKSFISSTIKKMKTNPVFCSRYFGSANFIIERKTFLCLAINTPLISSWTLKRKD